MRTAQREYAYVCMISIGSLVLSIDLCVQEQMDTEKGSI